MAQLWRADEIQCLAPLIATAHLDAGRRADTEELARRLIDDMRAHQHGGVEALLRSVALNSVNGVALLSLAESLLRVPDTANANRLVRDRLSRTHWRGSGGSGAWPIALDLAAALVGSHQSVRPLAALIGKFATPLIRIGVQLSLRAVSSQFIFSQDIEAALRRARSERRYGYRYSFDMLGEAALTAEDAQRYFLAYGHAIHAVGHAYRGHGPLRGGSVSVKLSALHPRYHYAQQGRIMQELLPRLRELARLAQQYDIALAIDAEEADRLELSLDLFEALATQPELADWGGLGIAVQAYQKRAPAVIDYLLSLAAQRRARLMVRLVKGAYWYGEIKLAQMEGLAGYPVYTRKLYTDVAYLACARRLIAAPEQILPQFATHNAQTVAAIVQLTRGAGANDYEFQCLYGMGSGLYRQLLASPQTARSVRIYAPVGTRATLLAYLMRRLLENGAATSFVHRAISPGMPLSVLSADPVAQAANWGGAPHPRIPLPRELFAPVRRNSAGVDLASAQARAMLMGALNRSRQQLIAVAPIVADAPTTPAVVGEQREIRNPADRTDLVGTVIDADEPDIVAAVAAASRAARGWADTKIERRAEVLELAAELFERQLLALVALTVREAGKSFSSGIAEVREAADYLRYYAAQIRAEFDHVSHTPLGVVLCISPWNFPLAIFTGQIAAALAAGNAVIAKPAEQTSAIASLAVQLLLQAGVPPYVLQLLPGAGARVGARLAADAGIAAVVFTGSTATARLIARALAKRGEVPLIAETGGQNAMIVDSTALPEQVVADVLRSAFDSAGQRCSALRVLCLQREIADPILTMLDGAMRELRVGDPADFSTDVGPLIDERARDRIESYLRTMSARIRCQTALSSECAKGVFIPPTLLEINSIDQLSAEVFGPVLHVLRFDRNRLSELIDAVNATGYALTLGIASRIDSTINEIIERTRAGNIYVNRNMIGAVVGLQPFGGQGLSGTGPKAGGPFFLHRLLSQSAGPQWQSDQLARVPFALQSLIAWLGQDHSALLSTPARQELALHAQHYADTTLLNACMPFEGYVGESNELRLRARGVLRGTAHSAPALLEQLAAALATGNALVADQTELARAVRVALPSTLARSLLDRTPGYDAVLVDGVEARLRPSWLQQLRCDLAAADGPIMAVIVASERYPLERLLVEHTVTVNTAAVGGDARLLALGDD